ncbi:hypothetical protein ALO80_101893 [Pseudomonas caricapapayae]|uniref:Uncharacterized protein n=1 Tax=Pseudomonas caricapapayae TaxID=46678 RepID=A0A0P9PH24_9PSED|nr:hypothetical protein ALO80_101893 [Pseudomonas caricapapayae]RMM06677.1 hypothetical protein ALQ84_101659 [Pseudomonas caricapapayae]RMV77037.1 hypothetical protein ALP05_101821 [Pseudomonas caricapapayae]
MAQRSGRLRQAEVVVGLVIDFERCKAFQAIEGGHECLLSGMFSEHRLMRSMCIRSGAPHQASGSVDCSAAPVVPGLGYHARLSSLRGYARVPIAQE